MGLTLAVSLISKIRFPLGCPLCSGLMPYELWLFSMFAEISPSLQWIYYDGGGDCRDSFLCSNSLAMLMVTYQDLTINIAKGFEDSLRGLYSRGLVMSLRGNESEAMLSSLLYLTSLTHCN